MSVTDIDVVLGARSYGIKVGDGLLAKAGGLIKKVRADPFKAFIVTDSNVAQAHLSVLIKGLAEASIAHVTFILPPGEETKTFGHLEQLSSDLIKHGIDRQSILIALGGGVVGDLTGFAAAIILRGVDFVQIPTSLLAQVDSSVGGKTGIDLSLGKNLVGAFHQPILVLADTGLLRTLPPRQIKAGYAEILKYGLIDDLAFFNWLEVNGPRVLELNSEAVGKAVAHSCENKARIVGADEKEQGQRALLNLGHTFGHAFETIAGLNGNLLHGEAVAMGMAFAMQLSVRLGQCPSGDLDRLTAHCRALNLPLHPKAYGLEIDVDLCLDHMRADKKNLGGEIRFILLAGIGKALLPRAIDLPVLRAFLQEALT